MYAEAIKKARTDAGLTLEQFGEKLGVTKQCVFNWETGVNKPNDQQRLKLHDDFGLDYAIFFGPESVSN